MSKDLYFLRSSEQKIIDNLAPLAHPKDSINLELYTKFYGLSTKDLGLYALIDNKIAGAIWSRELNGNQETPILSVALYPEFRNQGIGSFMMEQFLLEVATRYERLQIDISHMPQTIKFYESFGFEKIQDSKKVILLKKLDKKAIVRPTDGYDPRRWMD
ncbi:MAG: GNAT family N-acetyltransferase [Sulfurimonas sp.]|nr:MAG: GNAT family N-acetyltransferase [Sulfurimonas sp.]